MYVDSLSMAHIPPTVFKQYSQSLIHLIASHNSRDLVPDSNNNGAQAELSGCVEHAVFNTPNMFSRTTGLVSGWLNPLSPRLYVVWKAYIYI